MNRLPAVTRAVYGGGYRIQLTFSDGTSKTVDFALWLEGEVFEPLREQEYFRTFQVQHGTVSWPNGADIAPETLYEAPGVDEAA